MSNQKSNEPKKIGVRFNKATGAAYADMGEVIERELERIRKELATRHRSHRPVVLTGNNDNDRDRQSVKTS